MRMHKYSYDELKNGIQESKYHWRLSFLDADEAKRNAYTNAVTSEQILNKAQGTNTTRREKDNVEILAQNVQRAKNKLKWNAWKHLSQLRKMH